VKLSKSKDLLGSSIVLLALAMTLSGIVLINRSNSLENRIFVLGAFFACVFLIGYFIYAVKKPAFCLPFIICSSWLVTIEPAPTDVFASLGILALALSILVYKKPKVVFSLIDGLFLIFLLANIHNLINTYDAQYSYRYVSITFYLVLSYFLVSTLSDSYQLIERQLIIFFVPALITAFSLLSSYFGNVLGVSTGILPGLGEEGPRAMAFFKDPNVAGPFLILPGVYSFSRILNKRGKRNAIFFWIFLISCIGILVTLSRAAIISMVFSIFIVLVVSTDKKSFFKTLAIVLLSVVVIAASLFYLPKTTVFSRIHNTEVGVQSRAERIERGFSAFMKSPIIGTGMALRMHNEAPHDSYFLLLSQIGIFGFLAFWIPILFLTWKLLSAARNSVNIKNRTVLVTLGASLCPYFLCGFVIFFLHWRQFWYIAGLSAAAVRLLGDRQNPVAKTNNM
jgi:O-antigen ligase